jgi:uncharacterized membrane protein
MNNYNNSSVTALDSNLSKFERAVSALGGAYLMYDSFKNKRSIPEIVAAGFMLFRGISGYCPVTDAAQKLVSSGSAHDRHKVQNINIHSRLIVARPVDEVYAFWRNLSNLPLFMKHLESVTELNETRSEWKAKLPGGVGSISWNAEIVKEETNKFIGWRSLAGSTINNAGKVEFKDAGELGTYIHVTISYHPSMGSAGEEAAKLLSPVFEKMVREDILGFKRYMETGTPDKISQEPITIFT